MSLRRQLAPLAAVCVFLGGLVVLGGTPAHAAEDRVRVRAAGTFTAGRSAAGVTIEVRKRTDGCVRVRGALGLSLPGVRADQVVVQANMDGRWVPLAATGDAGLVTTAPVAPAKDQLCEGKSVTVRYRVAFAAEAPGGRLVVTGEATGAGGTVLGRAAVPSRVAGGRAPASPSPSPSPSSTPSAEAVEEPAAGATPSVALAVDGSGDLAQTAGESSGGSPVMYFGIAMVAGGILLIGLLVHRSGKDRKEPTGVGEVPSPRGPGGTTYRAGGGHGAAPVPPGPGVATAVPPGQVYGTGRPGAPRVYGGSPAARTSGGLYGARSGDSAELPRPDVHPAVPSATGEADESGNGRGLPG
ncbi:hypothetical protein [Micromonospora sp. LOL_024]|uniref:hypothetical protein n=1 Tax=Micromonospora sp. LOL_024 TaxID=3345412 RepID=UPI003A89FFA6